MTTGYRAESPHLLPPDTETPSGAAVCWEEEEVACVCVFTLYLHILGILFIYLIYVVRYINIIIYIYRTVSEN